MKINVIQEKKYHDSVATMYNSRRLHDYIWEIPEELFLLDKQYFKARSKILDMGCGPVVSVSRVLHKELRNINYTGVDISREMLRYAKRNIKNGTFICKDMSNPRLGKNVYDVLLSLGALHHCKHKNTTLEHWVTLVKSGGVLLLREPIYEFLKHGTGESPTEEGIKIHEFIKLTQKKKLKILRLTFFSTNAFHLFNRIMIKIGLGGWQRIRILWYPVVYVDAFLAEFSEYGSLFKPQAFAVILQKP